ncbi:ModD protein [Kalamiella sp. sgz302252]|uniref:ModD protein n=1 Tax=Pantoea sp. sgz302252 TaxID=3341827 RepID=UPI0036D250AA
MNFISDAQLDRWLLEDIQGGDLTTRALDIGFRHGRMQFIHRAGGCVSGAACAQRLLQRLGLQVEGAVAEGEVVKAGHCLLSAVGPAEALHQGWKAAQNLLEWSCGIAHYAWRMTQLLRRYVPEGQIAGSRKTFPGSRTLAQQALVAGGGIVHRSGLAETVLLFANHRRFHANPQDWSTMVASLRQQAPEKAIVVEADNKEEALAALAARPDILQLDKFSVADIAAVQQAAISLAPRCRLALAGGITLQTLETFAQTGVGLMITSAPYAASPADIGVMMEPVQ